MCTRRRWFVTDLSRFPSDADCPSTAPDDLPVESEEAGIRFHSQQSKFHEPDGPSYHRSAMSTSDDQTVKQSAEIPSFNQSQAHKHGAGHTHNLVDGMIRRQSIRKESPTPSQIPRPSPSPIRRWRRQHNWKSGPHCIRTTILEIFAGEIPVLVGDAPGPESPLRSVHTGNWHIKILAIRSG
jgi:hypothetical protein